MKKGYIAGAALFLVLLTAGVTAVVWPDAKSGDLTLEQALASENIAYTASEAKESDRVDVNGVRPRLFSLSAEERLYVYDYDTSEACNAAYEERQKQQLIMSSFSPIFFRADDQLILYYYNVQPSTGIVAATEETKYGEQLGRAIESYKKHNKI
ncbi:hypothetical protein [Paenibacillus sp. NEAU-GSW1]|uniref:hypothetical protein n=1 Tax=Paenibacillus sp. NEAU-GSW1 TaxID=2682486 RepID=UPI0012E1BEA1|nr:hypothetical protein [Paenibacillus sp. NEAU-GSW1]MUT66118.1 hypothetical protein [Paenibacillus sp. NEAU-GSW1]